MVELKNPAARHNVPAARIATLAPSNPVAWLSRGGLGAGNSKCLVFANSLPTVGTAQGVSVSPTAATVPPSHLTRVGNVVDGTNSAQISAALLLISKCLLLLQVSGEMRLQAVRLGNSELFELGTRPGLLVRGPRSG